MIHIICPPFVKGNNLRYLTNAVCKEFSDKHIDYKLYGYKELYEIPERRTDGFYNMDTWMMEDSSNVIMVYNKFEDYDYALFIDFWSPAVLHLKTHCILNDNKVYFVGWYHGSSTLEGDYLAQKKFESGKEFFKKLESAMYNAYDIIWYASEFFESGIDLNKREKFGKLIKVNEPFETKHYFNKRNTYAGNKKWDVVVPFRLDDDKMDMRTLRACIAECPDLKFLIASPVRGENEKFFSAMNNVHVKIGVSDEEHINDLADSKVVFSTALQEGWGYAVMKAITVGCIPVLPNRAVYPELYPVEYLYTTSGYAVKLIRLYVKNYPIKAFVPDDYYMEEAVEKTFINNNNED